MWLYLIMDLSPHSTILASWWTEEGGAGTRTNGDRVYVVLGGVRRSGVGLATDALHSA